MSKSLKNLQLWRYGEITGFWKPERTVTEETATLWLAIFKRDEPKAHFTISRNTPKGPPKGAEFFISRTGPIGKAK